MSVPAALFPSANLARTAALSLVSGAASASHPLVNIADNIVAKPFIANAAGVVRIMFDCVSPVRVDGVFLPMTNIPAGTLVKWQGHDSPSWGAPNVDITIDIPSFLSLGPDLPEVPESVGVDLRSLYSAAGRTQRYWSLWVDGFVSSPSAPLAIGELLFGPLTDLWGFSPDDNVAEDQTFEIVKQAVGRRWAFRFPILRRHVGGSIVVTGSEGDAFVALYREVGTADPFIWMPDPELEERGLLVAFDKPIPRKQLAPPMGSVESLHQIRVDLTEVVRGLPL